jgi:hypothetical protein
MSGLLPRKLTRALRATAGLPGPMDSCAGRRARSSLRAAGEGEKWTGSRRQVVWRVAEQQGHWPARLSARSCARQRGGTAIRMAPASHGSQPPTNAPPPPAPICPAPPRRPRRPPPAPATAPGPPDPSNPRPLPRAAAPVHPGEDGARGPPSVAVEHGPLQHGRHGHARCVVQALGRLPQLRPELGLRVVAGAGHGGGDARRQDPLQREAAGGEGGVGGAGVLCETGRGGRGG